MSSSTILLRSARKWHKKVASVLFVFFFVISITGILLGWKSLFSGKLYNAGKKQKTTASVKDWLPLDSLRHLAMAALRQKVPAVADGKPERMDARMDKGTVRFSFSNQYNVELNAQTGELQSVDKRAPDWIIKLHDGELIDDLIDSKNGGAEKTYVSVMGAALFFLTLSGFWMWFKPRQLKNARRETVNEF